MLNPITSRMSVLSLNKLASELKTKYDSEFKELQTRTLGARLGELNKGDAAWWDRHPEQLSCLLQHLALKREDLGSSTQAAPYEYLFREFPAIPALDFRKEDLCDLGRPVPVESSAPLSEDRRSAWGRGERSLQFWIGAAGMTPRAIQWLQVEDAVERELLVKKLSVRGRHQIIVRQAMDDLIKHHSHLLHESSPLIVAIQKNLTLDTLEDFASRRRNDAPRLIISPFSPPDVKPSHESSDGKAYEAGQADSQTTTQIDASHSGTSEVDGNSTLEQQKSDSPSTQISSIERWIWILDPQWRRKLLEWVGTRMERADPDRRFDVHAAHALLERVDAEGRWFSRVSEVLSLCRAIADNKEEELEEAMARADSANRLVDLLFGNSNNGMDLTRHLVQARWADQSLDWTGGIPKASWTSICPNRLDADILISRGIITAVSADYDFAKPIIARLLLRDHLVEVMEKGEVSIWAPACFDPDRRPWVDAALDALRIGSLERMSSAIHADDASANALAAREALFTAMGRRLIRSDFQQGEDRARAAFVSEVLPRLAVHPKLGVEPLSRPPVRREECVDWIATCWAWSLATAPMGGWTGHWLFPGWSSAPPAGMMDRFSNSRDDLVSPPGGWDNHPEEMLRLFKVAARWMGTLSALPYFDGGLPIVFRMALLAHAAAGKWEAEPGWWLGILTERGPENALRDWLHANKQISELDVARRWWPSLVAQVETRLEQRDRFQVWGSEEHDDLVPSMLYNEVCRRMESHADEAMELLGSAQHKILCAHPQILTPALKCALLRQATKSDAAIPSYDRHRFLSRFGADVADELGRLTSHPQIGATAAWHLWEWRPNLARLMLKSVTTEDISVTNLIRSCGFDALDLAIDRLHGSPSLLSDDERERWIRSWLPKSRQHAKALLDLRTL